MVCLGICVILELVSILALGDCIFLFELNDLRVTVGTKLLRISFLSFGVLFYV